MSDTNGERPREFRSPSRREWLKRVGIAGTAAALPFGEGPAAALESTQQSSQPVPARPVPREPLQALTAAEADTLDAVVARLIPSDANGPGAAEAGAVRYIDRALAGGLKDQREAYSSGLAAFDRYCRMSKGGPFTALSATDQDAVLVEVENGAATASGAGFVGSSTAFFAMVRAHTLQGTFGDPYYGGNANFVGWDLIGYPGVRTVVTAEMTRLGAVVEPNHRSAYESDAFVKATAQLGGHGAHHGE